MVSPHSAKSAIPSFQPSILNRRTPKWNWIGCYRFRLETGEPLGGGGAKATTLFVDRTERLMSYRVEFNHETSGLIAVEKGIELLQSAKALARESLHAEGATFTRVINEDSAGEVWSIRKAEDGELLES